jgi:ribosome-associated protein
MIQITPTLAIEENEISEEFVRAAGPGGQNVNKVSTAVQLRFNVAQSPSLPEDVRQRLQRLAGKRLTTEGELIIVANQARSQLENRAAALQQLIDLIQRATIKPKPRRPTKPSVAARERRLDHKRRHSVTKRQRRSRPSEE